MLESQLRDLTLLFFKSYLEVTSLVIYEEVFPYIHTKYKKYIMYTLQPLFPPVIGAALPTVISRF
jgi:hypothetical protein